MNREARPAKVAKVAGLVALVALVATGCDVPGALYFGWPEGITDKAESMRTLWTWFVIVALIVGFIVWGLIVWSVIFHRKTRLDKKDLDKKDPDSTGPLVSGAGNVEAAGSKGASASGDGGYALPRQFQYNVTLELFCVIVPIIMVCVLFFFTIMTGQKVLAEEKDPDVTVDVVAFQWNWEFSYLSGPETPDGDVVSTVGTSNRIPLLVLPTNRTIEYKIHSTDVIHAFWVVDFNFKRDVFPYPRKNNQDDTFQNEIHETGAFVGRCAELCGTYHSAMNFELRALPPKKFDRYMDLRTKTDPATGKPYTAAGALAKMQDEGCGQLCSPTAVTTHPFITDRTADSAIANE